MRDEISQHDPLRVLVAGGAGFIGSHICEALLERGDAVVCLDSFLTGARENVARLTVDPRFTLIEHDVCAPCEPPGRIDRIVNLACPASPRQYQADPVHTMLTSVAGAHNLLALAERHGARFLQASTSEVYGDPKIHPQREGYVGHVNCTGPRACYDEGKRAAETLCFDMLRLGRVDVRVARIFNTYGPRMRHDDGRVVSNLIVQALDDRPMTIYGDGGQTRSFCYVADMVRGLLALLDLPHVPGGPVNLGNPDEITVLALARAVQRQIGGGGIVFEPLPVDDPQRRRPDIARARALLGWRPETGLTEGLAATIRHFRQAAPRSAPVPRSPAAAAPAP
jgi:UDP-glucuronate decarboxylase